MFGFADCFHLMIGYILLLDFEYSLLNRLFLMSGLLIITYLMLIVVKHLRNY